MSTDDREAIAAWLDGDLDAAGCTALAARLAADPRVAQELFSQSAIDGQLRATFATTAMQQGLTQRVMQALPGAASPTTAHHVLRRIAQQRSWQQRRRVSLWAGGGASLAAAALVLMLMWLHHQQVDGPQVIAYSGTVRQSSGGTVALGTRLAVDGRVETGADSCVAVAYADGTRLALAESGSLTWGGAGHALRLDAGSLEVNAAPHPPEAPLTIVTPQGRVEVVGTRFSVATRSGATTLLVSAGTVAFSGAAVSGVSGVLSVRAGERAVVSAGQPARSLPRPVFLCDGEDGELGPFVQAGRLVAPPAGNASCWCLRAETRGWTGAQRQVAGGAYPRKLFAYDPALLLEFDYWVAPRVPWASVWLGNCVDYSIQNLTLKLNGAGTWQHASIRLADLRADPDPTGRYRMRRADPGDGIGMMGFAVPEGGWELYIDNVCIAQPER